MYICISHTDARKAEGAATTVSGVTRVTDWQSDHLVRKFLAICMCSPAHILINRPAVGCCFYYSLLKPLKMRYGQYIQ